MLAAPIRGRHIHRELHLDHRRRLRTSSACAARSVRWANMCQKIRTIELDGKTVKLQIVRISDDI